MSYLLTTRGMCLCLCEEGTGFNLSAFTKEFGGFLFPVFCANLVCAAVCWQGVNKQQIPQGRVHSVDMLLKLNFLIF